MQRSLRLMETMYRFRQAKPELGKSEALRQDPGADGQRASEARGCQRRGPGGQTDWRQRCRDCLNASQLLGALHSDWQLEVVHRPFDHAPQG